MSRASRACRVALLLATLAACVPAAPAPESASASTSAQATTAVVRENAEPGTGTWRIGRPAGGALAAFASRSSVAAGEKLDIAVSARSAGTSVTLEFFRLGAYGGQGGRSMLRVGPLPAPARGSWSKFDGVKDMPGPSAVGYLAVDWPPLYTLTVPADWTTGYYVVKVTGAAGVETYAPFIVRDDREAHDVVVQASVTTWQAYNAWGGYSLYGRYDAAGAFLSGAPNGRVVSFDRPYENDDGAGFMLSQEIALITWLEAKGYDLAYVTDLDTDAGRPSWYPKVFVSVGHNEYWSDAMRQNVVDMRAHGVHVAFLGGNDLYWQTRLGASRNGEARELARFAYWHAAGAADSELTGLTAAGVVSGAYTDLVVSAASHWVYDGTGLKDGDRIRGVVGYEADRVDPATSPAGLQILATSPFVALDPEIGATVAHVVIYRTQSGAWVFSVGTINWPASVRSDARIATMTSNVIARMLADSALVSRPRAFVARTPSPTPAPTPPNANLLKNGQPAGGSDASFVLASGMRASVVADVSAVGGSAYRLEFASASSQARNPSIPVDPATTYCVAANLRVEAPLRFAYRVTWQNAEGTITGPEGVSALISGPAYATVRLDGLRPPAGTTRATLTFVAAGPGVAYASAIRVEAKSACGAWAPALQFE